MTSTIALPFVIVNMGCELMFILEQRIRKMALPTLPDSKKNEILQELHASIFNPALLSTIQHHEFLYTVKALKNLCREMLSIPSMKLTEENFERVFNIALMTFKSQVTQIISVDDLTLLNKAHIRHILELRDRWHRLDIADTMKKVEAMCDKLYSKITLGEVQRIRSYILTYFAEVHVPVTVLVDHGLQLDSGVIYMSTAGPSSVMLGNAKYFSKDNTVFDAFELPIAGRGLDEKELAFGENLFSQEVEDLAQQEKELEETPILAVQPAQ